MSSLRIGYLFTLSLFLASLSLAIPLDSPAQATPITYQYGGVITSADPSTGVSVGTPFSGTFTFDPAAKLAGISDTADDDARFYGTGAGFPQSSTISVGTGLSLQIGGLSIVAPSGGLVLNVNANSSPGHPGYGAAGGLVGPYTVLSVSNTYDGGEPINVALTLKNLTTSVFGPNPTATVDGSNFGLPTQLNLTEFPIATLAVTGSNSQWLYSGTIVTLTVVPEPALSISLSLVAAIWLVHSSRNRLGGDPS